MDSYGALLRGSIGDPARLIGALLVASIGSEVKRAFGPLSETLVSATPLIFTGLSVALAFRAGLFNIGAEGQLYIGALFAIIVGFSFAGLPWFIHLPLAVLAGFAGGALWGFVPGILKARTGAHEVIMTIMLNFVAYRIIDYALRTPFVQREGRPDPISKVVEPGAVPRAAHRGAAGALGHRDRAASRRSSCRGSSSAQRRASSSARSGCNPRAARTTRA